MLNNLSPRERNLAMITAIVAVLGLGWIAYGMIGQGDAASAGGTDLQNFEDLFLQMQSIDEQKDRNRSLRQRLGNLQGSFIREDELPRLFAEMEQLAGQTGVEIKNISTRLQPRTRPLPTLEADLQLQCRYPQLIQFFDRLRNASVILQPAGFRVTLMDRNRPDLQVQMKLKTLLIESRPGAASPTSLQIGETS